VNAFSRRGFAPFAVTGFWPFFFESLAMDNNQTSAVLETQLHEQLGEIGREISRLMAEREALKRILVRVSPGRRLPRADGHGRHLVETRVLDILRSAHGAPVSTRDLLAEVRKAHPGLKEVTFRSQLHRLKKRSLIMAHDQRGHWRVRG
jgi:hypothetical protein